MRLLIDTNIFIYMATDPDSLSHDVRTLLEDYENRICISVESVRELVGISLTILTNCMLSFTT